MMIRKMQRLMPASTSRMSSFFRRDVIKAGVGIITAGIAPPPRAKDLNRSLGAYSTRARSLVDDNVVIDMLNQFLYWDVKRNGTSLLDTWLVRPSAFTADDFERYASSGIDVFAVGQSAGSYEAGIEWFAYWNGFIAAHDDRLARVDDISDILRIRSQGKVGLMLTFQNAEHFRNTDDVDKFYQLGQRACGLTYNWANRLGSGAFEESDKGLTKLGRSILERMNQVGMAVDLAHCSPITTLDAIAHASAPPIISHGNCDALNPGHPRAYSDEAIQALADKGGVMGVNFIRALVSHKEPTTIEHLLDHFDHISNLVGVEHVGIGSDYDLDGFDAIPEARDEFYEYAKEKYQGRYKLRELDNIEAVAHPRRVYDLAEGLIRRGYSNNEIALILGGNFQRVLTTIWRDEVSE